MTDKTQSLPHRLARSVKGHLRVALIALVFGMTAYGLIHILIWAVHIVEHW